MIIPFKYTVTDSVYKFMLENIKGKLDKKIDGYFDDMDAGQLYNRSLYMVCRMHQQQTKDKNNSYTLYDPVVVVAKNQTQAMEIYKEATSLNDSTILAELEERCSNIKVEAYE